MSSQNDDHRVAYVLNGRPAFFDDPVNDKLLAMLMALLGEVCVLRDRLDSHERLAAARGQYTPADVEAYVPDAAAAAERRAVREAAVARVLSVLGEEVARLRES